MEPCQKCCSEPTIKFIGPFFNPVARPIVPFYKCMLKLVQNNETLNMTEPPDDPDEFPWWRFEDTYPTRAPVVY